MMNEKNIRKQLQSTRRWVIKIGSALLTDRESADERQGLHRDRIAQWVEQITGLRSLGIEVVLVSSGAIAEGMMRLGWETRPKATHELQAAAAVGQMGLVQAYESEFQRHGIHAAQILLDQDDLNDEKRCANARNTLQTLLGLGVIPIVNENDTVATDEICFGDNDTLGALVANLVEADALIILTDQLGLFDEDPRLNLEAKLISTIGVENKVLESMAGSGGSALGRGGMLTKVRAAKTVAKSGCCTVIASGKEDDVLIKIQQGDEVGTVLFAE